MFSNCQQKLGMIVKTCNRNPGLAKVLLAANIVVFLYAVSRMGFIAPDQKNNKIVTNKHSHGQSIGSRALQSLEQTVPCDCHSNEHKINQLQLRVSNLTQTVDKEKRTRLEAQNKCAQDLNNCQNTKSEKKRPVQIGEDIDKSKEFQVPNIVHYIWYSEETKPLEFHHMISILSADKYIKPDVIYFHTNNPPAGKYWDRVKNLARLKINMRDPPTQVFGETVLAPKFHTSHSNLDRILVLMEYGGIYMDFDFIVVQSFDDLRKHVCTVGLESDEKVCGSVIVCSKDAFFLYLWINAYFDDYRIDEWAYNTGQVPFNLAKRYPHLVNVEKTRLNRPNFKEMSEIWVKPTWWNWRENYGFHSWYRLWKDNWGGYFTGVEPDEDNVKTLNNTFGEIARVVLYDSPDFIR